MKILVRDRLERWNAWIVEEERNDVYFVYCGSSITAVNKNNCEWTDDVLISNEMRDVYDNRNHKCNKYNYETCYLCGRDMHSIYVDVNTDHYVCRLCAKKNALTINIIME